MQLIACHTHLLYQLIISYTLLVYSRLHYQDQDTRLCVSGQESHAACAHKCVIYTSQELPNYPCIPITTGLIMTCTKFLYFRPSIYTILHTKFQEKSSVVCEIFVPEKLLIFLLFFNPLKTQPSCRLISFKFGLQLQIRHFMHYLSLNYGDVKAKWEQVI